MQIKSYKKCKQLYDLTYGYSVTITYVDYSEVLVLFQSSFEKRNRGIFIEWYIDMGDHITTYFFAYHLICIGVYFFATVKIGARASVYLKSRLHN